MHAPLLPPTAFETLAGVVKFIAVPQLSAEFYFQHQNSVDVACSFLQVLASHYPPLEVAFRKALPLAVAEGAKHIEAGLREAHLPDTRLQWLDDQTTAVLRALVPAVRSHNLPEYLNESRWAVLGAFEDDEV